MDSFLYAWTDTATNKLYIGIHKGSINDGYVCSSKLMLEQYNKRPGDFIRQIIATGNYKDLLALENTILKKVDAKSNPSYYNQHNGDGDFYNKGHSSETRNKLKVARNKRVDKPRLGKPLSLEGKIKASDSAKKRCATEEGRQNLLKARENSFEKRKNDSTYRLKLSKSTKLIWERRKLGLLPYPKNMKTAKKDNI